ncbi:Ldh family oxidoreductase [Streptomyces armeniacus]|uniref:Ldh family oxidoreductase n=1 Tax=Streptomyces armeniacus TaxID=83291 RepID=A0A345XZF7_9ACTN|nr:Ldh family oxidoreductase [Streptomyces armeniacus]AXK37023.1 Ldh family oxidoreductase [Streptomyces armeniacus]
MTAEDEAAEDEAAEDEAAKGGAVRGGRRRNGRSPSPRTVGGARELAAALLTAAGVPSTEAARTAHAIVLADCWGIGSHGLLRLPYYLRRLLAGGCRADARLVTVTDTGPLVSYDGQHGLGHWQLWRAAELAAERCTQYGVAAVTVGRTSHCGALGIYTLPPVEAGQAALVLSNGPAVMPPWEGHRPVVSTSPLAAGFPGARSQDGQAPGRPAVVDLATSAVARGRIAQRAATGEPLPPGWAFDAAGRPTADASEALHGMLAPLGGAKGFALAFLVEAFTGGVVGPSLSTGVTDMFAAEDAASPQDIAHLVVAFDVERAAVDGAARERLAALSESVRQAGGRVPGEGRTPPEEIDPAGPLTVPDALADELATWARRLGVG